MALLPKKVPYPCHRRKLKNSDPLDLLYYNSTFVICGNRKSRMKKAGFLFLLTTEKKVTRK